MSPMQRRIQGRARDVKARDREVEIGVGLYFIMIAVVTSFSRPSIIIIIIIHLIMRYNMESTSSINFITQT